jgi:hypothetical protein
MNYAALRVNRSVMGSRVASYETITDARPMQPRAI